MALDFDIRDPKNQKLIAVFLILIVIIYAFYNFVIQSKVTAVESARADLATLEQRLMTIKKRLQTRETLEARKAELTVRLAELEALLPTEENVAVLLNQLVNVEQESKVYLVGFNAVESIEGDGRPYRANRYRVTIEAGYHQFVRFVGEVMRLPRLLSFSELRLEMNPDIEREPVAYEGLEDQPRHLRIECVLTAYIFRNLE